MSEEVSEWRAVITDKDLHFNFQMTTDEAALLMSLFESSGWKVYRKVLLSMKEGYVSQMLPCEHKDKVMKTLGIVVGLNAAINQLGTLVAGFKNKAASFKGEPKNPSQLKG